MAKNVTVAWELPTTRIEGGPLAPADVQHVQVQLSADGGVNYADLATVLPADPQQVFVPDMEIGTWLFRIRVQDTLGQFSVWHEEQVSVIDDSPPQTVTNVTVTQE